MVENEIKESTAQYSDEFKAELDRRVEYYLNSGKMISSREAEKHIQTILKPGKRK